MHTLLLKIDDIALSGKEGATVEHAVALRKTGLETEQFTLKGCVRSASGTGPNAWSDYETDSGMTVFSRHFEKSTTTGALALALIVALTFFSAN